MSRLKYFAVLAAVTAVLLASFPPLPAGAGAGDGISYILRHQASDGGFAEPGRSSGADATTAWCIMALRAAGRDPNEIRRGGRSPVDFLATQAGNWRSVTDYERTLLAAAAAGADLRSFGGVDLVAKVQSYQRAGGNIGDAINSNAFGILAYKAAGLAVPPGALDWHVRNQNSDGGWGNNPGAASNPDMTAASVMALRAAGVGASDPSIQSALRFLRSIQNDDGGFSFEPGSSDVSATAWCVQAIIAAGQDPAAAEWSRNGNTPHGFVSSMQAPDGRFYWMDGADRNPVWTTAYAVCALAGKTYPVAISHSSPHGGQGAAEDESAAGGIPAREPASPGQEGLAPASGEEGPREGSEAHEEGGGENGDVGTAEAGGQEEAAAAPQAEPAADNGGSGVPAASSYLFWLIPLLVALLSLSLGGWRLYRRYARKGL